MASADHSEFRNSRLESLLARISETIGPIRCELWFGEPGRIVWDDSGIEFRFDTEFAMNHVVRHHGIQLRQLAENLLAETQSAATLAAETEGSRATAVKFLVRSVELTQAAAETADAAAGNHSGGLGEKSDERLLPVETAAGFGQSLSLPGTAEEIAAGANITPGRAAEATGPGINGVRARFQEDVVINPRLRPAEREPASSTLRRGHTLETFCFGPANQMLETVIRENLSGASPFSPLLIHGPCGSGKSHLLEAFYREFRAAGPQRRGVCLTAEEFLNEFVICLRKAGLPMFRRKFRDLHLLAIDDIHFLAGKTATLTELNFTLAHLVKERKQVILTTDRQLSELEPISPELVSRLQAGINLPVRYPDFTGRRKILETICAQRKWTFAESVLDLIAEGVERDCRRLAGALNRVRAAELASGRAATRESACRDLSDLIAVGESFTTLPRIEKLVCEACGIPPAQLRSESRKKRISSARMLAMWLSRRHTSNALSEIGDYFGGRSHSAVVAAEKRVEQWLDSGGKIEMHNGVVPVHEAVQLLARRLRVG